MYTFTNYERALRQFRFQVEYICAAEMSGKIDSEEAYNESRHNLRQSRKLESLLEQAYNKSHSEYPNLIFFVQ